MLILERTFQKIVMPDPGRRKSRGYTQETMARSREFDVDEALDRATELFWTRGYEATSVQDLVDALGVNRASLYGTFGDKAQLFAAVLDRYDQHVNAAVCQELAAPASGVDAIRAWFRALIQAATHPTGPRGCLLIGTLSASSDAPDSLRDRVVLTVRASTDRVQEALARDPHLARRDDLRTLARFFAAEGHGLAVLARAGVRRQELEAAAEVALRVLEPAAQR
jgi:TetR/AcrR family transcriptional regulator, transcriptional repressor for nem operon